MFVDESTWMFIDEHLNEDVRQLALQKKKYNDIDFEFALQQIQGRQKTRDKLPSMGSIPRFVFPPSLALEQCSSETTAQYKVSFVEELMYGDVTHAVCDHCTMADLTGGFGVDTLYLSGLFETCHYVEPQSQLCDILSYNLKLVQKHNVVVHQDTMEHYVENMDAVDFIYLDPSRRDLLGRKVSGLEACTPNVLQYKDMLLHKADMLMLKLSPMLDIKRALNKLPETRDVIVMAVEGECKELVLVLTKDTADTLLYHAVNLLPDKDDFTEINFDFTEEEEKSAVPQLSGKLYTYLYEPNAAILKAGGFKCIATRFNLKKLHQHSHLYTSDTLLKDFPGRIFNVQDVFTIKEAKTALRNVKKANVAIRNFPMCADELKRCLKLKDGGDVYLFGTTLKNGQKSIVSCTKEVFI